MLKTNKDINAYLKEVSHRNMIEQNSQLFSLINDIKRRVQESLDNEKYNYVFIKTTKKWFYFINIEREQPAVLIQIVILNDGYREALSKEFYDVIMIEVNKMFLDHSLIKFDVIKNMTTLMYNFFLRPNQ